VTYQAGEFYAPGQEGGVRWSDPRLGLVWPLPVTDMSPKDDAWSLLADVEPELKRRMTLNSERTTS
jgi:dTDP-4-dehydrorhamnose 3,5-epimerase